MTRKLRIKEIEIQSIINILKDIKIWMSSYRISQIMGNTRYIETNKKWLNELSEKELIQKRTRKQKSRLVTEFAFKGI